MTGEPQTGVMKLEDEDERIFRTFVAWLCSQKVLPPKPARSDIEDNP